MWALMMGVFLGLSSFMAEPSKAAEVEDILDVEESFVEGGDLLEGLDWTGVSGHGLAPDSHAVSTAVRVAVGSAEVKIAGMGWHWKCSRPVAFHALRLDC